MLCINDIPQASELRKARLESHGYCVEIAPSGYSATKMWEKVSVAAVLSECKQEGMDAEAAACHIKQQFPAPPIILLSAYSELPERILWLVDEYVMKSELRMGWYKASNQRPAEQALTQILASSSRVVEEQPRSRRNLSSVLMRGAETR